jgi:hypothetical protein
MRQSFKYGSVRGAAGNSRSYRDGFIECSVLLQGDRDDTSVRLLLPSDLPEVTEDDPKSRRVWEVFEAAKSKGLNAIDSFAV